VRRVEAGVGVRMWSTVGFEWQCLMCGSGVAGGGALGWAHRTGEVGVLKTSPMGIARLCGRSEASGFLVN
jgi:hypothetical protein